MLLMSLNHADFEICRELKLLTQSNNLAILIVVVLVSDLQYPKRGCYERARARVGAKIDC